MRADRWNREKDERTTVQSVIGSGGIELFQGAPAPSLATSALPDEYRSSRGCEAVAYRLTNQIPSLLAPAASFLG
ncbi:MAG: hypothetical protein ACREIA_18490, partial [Opitutaceae bacterium]